MHAPAMHRCPAAHPWIPASAVAGRHSTQRFARPSAPPPALAQYGVGTPPSAPPVVPAQSAFERHATHWFVVVSQTGAAAVVHCASLVHPARHAPLLPHTGVAPEQSALDAHCTQALFLQRGVDPEQSASNWHCTHVCVFESQTARDVGQLAEVTQPTQAPVAVSHMRPAPHWTPPPPPSAEQAGRHVCVPG